MSEMFSDPLWNDTAWRQKVTNYIARMREMKRRNDEARERINSLEASLAEVKEQLVSSERRRELSHDLFVASLKDADRLATELAEVRAESAKLREALEWAFVKMDKDWEPVTAEDEADFDRWRAIALAAVRDGETK